MFLTLNKDLIIYQKDIIGIFNINYIKNTKEYKKMYKDMEEKKQIFNISDKQEKTLIIIQNKENTKGYVINISANTIAKRMKLKY